MLGGFAIQPGIPYPTHFQEARLGAFSWQWDQSRKYCQE